MAMRRQARLPGTACCAPTGKTGPEVSMSASFRDPLIAGRGCHPNYTMKFEKNLICVLGSAIL